MESPTLDDFVAWNDQLAALIRAGVPLDVGLDAPGKDVAETLERITATVARRVGRGESLREAIEDDDRSVPPAYRSLVELGLRSGNLSAALNDSNRVAESIDDSRYVIQSSFIYPLVVCFLAFAGLILFCLFFVPTLAAMYQSLRLRPGSGLRVMQWLRETLPYWSAVLPLALVLFLLRLWRTKSRDGASRGRATGFLTLIPGLSQAAFQERCASFAESLASLVESQVPLEDALPLAAGVCGDARLVGAAQSLAAALKQGQVPDDNDPAATGFPPFLRWAMLHSEATVGRPRALQMAADLYRQAAQRREERLRIVAPIVVCVVLGGSATLLYGLSLFVPVVQLLRALAS